MKGNGPGVTMYLISHNFAYIGNDYNVDNDANTVIQANEVVATNGAKIHFSSVDHKGDFRTGDYGLVCQNESGSYNTDMENYIYSPVIEIPAGDQVGVDFLVRGSLLDGDVFPEVDYWGMQLTADGGQSWYYVSNPYGDTTASNYVYSDAPEFWSLFSTTYSEPIDISNYAGSSIQMRYWFHSDSDAPQGEGLFLDDIAVSVDGEDIYFESFEDSTMAGWVY